MMEENLQNENENPVNQEVNADENPASNSTTIQSEEFAPIVEPTELTKPEEDISLPTASSDQLEDELDLVAVDGNLSKENIAAKLKELLQLPIEQFGKTMAEVNALKQVFRNKTNE